MDSNSEAATNTFRKGGIVIFPTDTAFGMGCRVDIKSSIEKLFEIRKRPRDMAVPVLFANKKMVEEYVLPLDERVASLMNRFWPGALTIILKAKPGKIPDLVMGGGHTLGVRIPDHKNLLSVISILNLPILGPSANYHGEKTPYSVSELNPDLVSKVDYVMEGETRLGNISTVIDCTTREWKILRRGAVELTV